MEDPSWDMTSSEISKQEQSMFNYGDGLSSLRLQQVDNNLFFIDSVVFYDDDAAEFMDDDNYATLLECFVNVSSLQIALV